MYVTISARTLLACAAMAGDVWGLTIVALSLFAKPGEESLAVGVSMFCTSLCVQAECGTSRAVVMLACLSQGRRGASAGQQRRGTGQIKQNVLQSPL
jgi:hypothetical protein